MNAPTPPKPPSPQEQDKAREEQEKARDAEIAAEAAEQAKLAEQQQAEDDKATKASIKENAGDKLKAEKGADVALADDADKFVTVKVPVTAHNSKPSDVKLEDAYSGTLHNVVDPFREGTEDPFTHDGFVGVDPSQAIVSETRRPDPENDDVKVED